MKKFLVLVVLAILSYQPANANSIDCRLFDQWFLSDGANKYDYVVEDSDWNLPSDAELISTLTLTETSIWEYISNDANAKYFIVFLTMNPRPNSYGQHDICVYTLKN